MYSPLAELEESIENGISETVELNKNVVFLKKYPLERPRTRAGCHSMPRPCPFMTCRHHLALCVDNKGRITWNRLLLGVDLSDIQAMLEALPETCSLDVVDKLSLESEQETTLEKVGSFLGLTRERVRQIEMRGLIGMQSGLDEFAPS